ncbi:MAG TPA: GNAT family N-acetyltransferase [Pyrinomonadaceae bacterium]|nr:GNAT family N-acetyltransferase [Pyrinomonadaceae bacterium]
MTVTLRDVDRENFKRCVKLEVREDQKNFVASNVYSIAQSKVEPTFATQAVYDGDEMVGFVMYGYDTDDDCYCIARVMIDKNHQGKGYGRAAMEEVVRRLRETPDCREVALSIEPENEVAERLYESLGFKKTGEVVQGEVAMRLKFD